MKPFKRLLRGLVGISLVACGGHPTESNGSGSTTSLPLPPGADWERVDRAYPFIGDHGETVCTVWRHFDPDGSMGTQEEFYLVEKMNDILAGRPLADGGVWDPAQVEYIKASGLTQVRTCEEARTFVGRATEFRELGSEETTSVVPAAADETEDATNVAANTDSVNKVADSYNYLDPAVVRLASNLCSGALISKTFLITAGHCFGAEGLYFEHIDYGIDHPEYGCISAHCNDSSSFNVRVRLYPGFVGSSDTQHDFALVQSVVNIFPSGFPYPWISPLGFETLQNLPLDSGVQYWVDGYGYNADSGGSPDVQRSANAPNTVDNASSGQYFYTYTVHGRGRPCKRDSGSPAILYDTSLNPEIAIGVVSNSQFSSTNGICPSPGDKFRYSTVWDKVGWITQYVPNCTAVAGLGNQAYMQCF